MTIPPVILTINGSYFDFMNPEESTFSVEDIAHALSHVCRFAGHTKRFYSVAQHSVLVSLNVPEEYALEGLLHDAAEAFIGDISTPLKQLLPEYKIIEKRIEKAVFNRFGLHEDLPVEVKLADLIMLATEKRDLMVYVDDEAWPMLNNVVPMAKTINPLLPVEAAALFLERYEEIIRGSKCIKIG